MRHVIAFCLSFVVCAGIAWAADKEDATCSVSAGTVTAGRTNSTQDGGVCTWAKGATVLMQCDQDIYFRQSSTVNASTSTSADFQIKFTMNPDPYKVFLGNNNDLISVLAVSATSTCKFADSPRRKPW